MPLNSLAPTITIDSIESSAPTNSVNFSLVAPQSFQGRMVKFFCDNPLVGRIAIVALAIIAVAGLVFAVVGSSALVGLGIAASSILLEIYVIRTCRLGSTLAADLLKKALQNNDFESFSGHELDVLRSAESLYFHAPGTTSRDGNALNLVCCGFDVHAGNLTDEQVGHIVRLCPNLRHLGLLEGQHDITDAALEHISRLEKLVTLDVSKCEKITDAGMEYFKHMPLRSINMSGCPRLTDASRGYFMDLHNRGQLHSIGI